MYPKIEEMNEEQIYKEVLKTLKEDFAKDICVFKYPGVKEKVSYTYSELVALCPMTGILDLYTVTIEYVPDKYVPELKSLKFYFLKYQNRRISHEALASKIFVDFKKKVKPKQLRIILKVAVRGGIETVIEVK